MQQRTVERGAHDSSRQLAETLASLKRKTVRAILYADVNA
jgi:hypothetical protein